MNSSKKYFKNLCQFFMLSILIINTCQIYPASNQLDEEVLANMMENLYAKMTPAEQEAFAQEVELQQQKIMQMSPEERDNYEKMMLSELDQLMATTPELFEKPQEADQADRGNIRPSVQPDIATKSEDYIPQKPVNTAPPKPKPITISQELKDQSRKNMRNILQAIDTILLKTNQMHDIMHASWNKGRWLNLRTDLQNLKTYLPMIVNSNKLLTELLSKSEQALVNALKDFENLITHLAAELKTPDSMGLVNLRAGKTQIVDQALYEQAVLKLKEITDKLTTQLAHTKLIANLKSLLDRHAPEQLKAAIGKKTKKNSCQLSPVIPICKTIDQTEIKNQAQSLTVQLTKVATPGLLELLVQYQKSPSTNLRRKLQWKLSELEIYLERLVKLANTSVTLNCTPELASILNAIDYATLDQVVATLNLIDAADLGSELRALYKQLRLVIVPA